MAPTGAGREKKAAAATSPAKMKVVLKGGKTAPCSCCKKPQTELVADPRRGCRSCWMGMKEEPVCQACLDKISRCKICKAPACQHCQGSCSTTDCTVEGCLSCNLQQCEECCEPFCIEDCMLKCVKCGGTTNTCKNCTGLSEGGDCTVCGEAASGCDNCGGSRYCGWCGCLICDNCARWCPDCNEYKCGFGLTAGHSSCGFHHNCGKCLDHCKCPKKKESKGTEDETRHLNPTLYAALNQILCCFTEYRPPHQISLHAPK